jgi:hypothetical protein
MSLFSFANISFKSKTRKLGVDKNNLGANFQYDIYRYPIDLGSSDKGHYMMFHINQQKSSKLLSREVNDTPTIVQNKTSNQIASPADIAFKAFGADASQAAAFTRATKRVSDTVALYMPDTLTFTNQQGYSDLSLTGMAAATGSILGQGSSIVDTLKNNTLTAADIKSLANQFSPAFATYLKDKSALGSALFTAYSGLIINPMLEMVYSSPAFREFRFDFMFYPRDEKEGVEVQNIINRLYFHQAPEVNVEGSGFFLVPPSEFDILFYYNGKINPNIPKISTCVLTSIDVDYAPNGFAAYELQNEMDPQLGRTGMPVAIRLSLNFKETEIMTKRNFNNNARTGPLGTIPGSQQAQMLIDQVKDFF